MKISLRDIHAKVLAFFDGDEEKARTWFETPNPLLGEMSPAYMAISGQSKRLARWIDEQLKDNEAALEGGDSAG